MHSSQESIVRLDVVVRTLLRTVVGIPGFVVWDGLWHEIFEVWNEKVNTQTKQFGQRTWSHPWLTRHSKFSMYVALLLCTKLAQRVLHWTPRRQRCVGKPARD